MDKFFKDNDGNLSMGRLLSLVLFFTCTGMWIIIKFTTGVVDASDVTLIQWGWIAAIGGKAVQKFGEKK